MSHNRAEKLAGALRKKISEILQGELRDPRIGIITITEVKVAKDLKYATVYFSVLGGEKEKKSAGIGLDRATGFIKRIIAKEMILRCVPEIKFRFDETFECGQRVNELLEKIKKEEEERNT